MCSLGVPETLSWVCKVKDIFLIILRCYLPVPFSGKCTGNVQWSFPEATCVITQQIEHRQARY